MSDITISYKGSSIATMDATGTKTLLTEGKYCEDDITVDYVKPSGGDPYEIANQLLLGTITVFESDASGILAGGRRIFQNQKSLTKLSLPNITQLGNSANDTVDSFASGCSNMTTLELPKLEKITGGYVFRYCASLQTVVLPKVYYTYGQYIFGQCTSLTAFDCGAPDVTTSGGFNQYVFSGDTNLSVIILRHGTVRSLSNINNFTGTPFASDGTGGTLYVPNDLIASYQSASNWSTILGYANNQIKSIESTHTDPNAPVDLTTHYIDGTLIPTS